MRDFTVLADLLLLRISDLFQQFQHDYNQEFSFRKGKSLIPEMSHSRILPICN